MPSTVRQNLSGRWTTSDGDDEWCSNGKLLMLACLRQMSTVLSNINALVCTLSQLVPPVIDLVTLIVLCYLFQESGEHNL